MMIQLQMPSVDWEGHPLLGDTPTVLLCLSALTYGPSRPSAWVLMAMSLSLFCATYSAAIAESQHLFICRGWEFNLLTNSPVPIHLLLLTVRKLAALPCLEVKSLLDTQEHHGWVLLFIQPWDTVVPSVQPKSPFLFLRNKVLTWGGTGGVIIERRL